MSTPKIWIIIPIKLNQKACLIISSGKKFELKFFISFNDANKNPIKLKINPKKIKWKFDLLIIEFIIQFIDSVPNSWQLENL